MAKQTIEQLAEHLKELNSQASSPLSPSPPTTDKEKREEAYKVLNGALEELREYRNKKEE